VDGGQPDRAVPILERLCLDHPGEDLLVGPLLDALIEAGRYERADQHVLDRLNDNPENEHLLRLFLNVLAQSQRTDQALELINSKLLDTRNRLGVQIWAIGLLDLADRHEECLERIEAAIDEQLSVPSPEQTGLDQLRRLLISKLIDVERCEEAERLLYAWIAQTAQRSTLFGYLTLLSICQDTRGLTDQAVVTKQRALALQPDDVVLNNDLAYSWIDQGVRLDDAEPMIRYALSSAPRSSAYLDTYGWLMYKRGEFAEARKWLTRALYAETERDPVILDHLGDACWRLGLKDEAIEHWSEAVRSLNEREERPGNADERRVLETTALKIEAAKADGTPEVAALAARIGEEETE
jgi:tetratricopeptide (TPR) repeat protein